MSDGENDSECVVALRVPLRMSFDGITDPLIINAVDVWHALASAASEHVRAGLDDPVIEENFGRIISTSLWRDPDGWRGHVMHGAASKVEFTVREVAS